MPAFRRVGLVLAALAMIAAAGAAPVAGQTATPAPDVVAYLPLDAFYTPPVNVPAHPGVILRQELLTDRTLPIGARAWRLLYTTTFPDGSPAVGAATVLAPLHPPPGPRPVITWEHGTVGIDQHCLPSLTTTPFAGVPALDQLIAQGWALVAADYAPNAQGVHPYLIGEGEARSALDATRAARTMPELNLSARTVVWGHSQGGHAALWTGIIGLRYAPDLTLLGVAAIAPASNMTQIMLLHDGDASGARLGAYLATAYSQYYPDVKFDDAVTPGARAIAPQLAALCQFDPKEIPTLQALTAQLHGLPVLADPAGGAFGARLRQNAPDALIAAPLLIVQGLADVVVYPVVNDAYVAARCAAGQSLEYWRVPGRDHGGIVAPGSPLEGPLIAWTAARFAGMPAPTGCQQATFGG